MIKKFLALIFCFVLLNAAFGDSIWSKNSSSIYSTDKAYKVGDILTIIVVENTDAQQKAGTTTTVKDDLSLKLTNNVQKLASLLGSDSSITGQTGNKYAGSGTTQRASTVTAKISATVAEVMENGNLRIEGRRVLDINDESQEILISGIIRSKDVSPANTVYSYQVADAQVSFKGTGAVQEAEAPGWFTRILNWLF